MMTQKEFLFKKITNKEFAHQIAEWSFKSLRNYGILMVIVGLLYYGSTKNVSTSLFEAPIILILTSLLNQNNRKNKIIIAAIFTTLLASFAFNLYGAYKFGSFSGGMIIQLLALYISVRLLAAMRLL